MQNQTSERPFSPLDISRHPQNRIHFFAFFWEIVGLYRLMNRSLICVRHAAVFAHAFVECKPAARRFSAYAVGTSSRSRAYGSLIEGCKARSASEPSHVNHAST